MQENGFLIQKHNPCGYCPIFFAASSPDETSRSSSSLGCLEPRPSRLSPTSTPVHPTPHDLLSRLTTEDCVRGEESCSDTHSLSDVGGVVAPPTEGVDSPRSVEATISSSQSTQSLNTLFGIPKGKKSFASIFNRYGSTRTIHFYPLCICSFSVYCIS